MSGVRPVLGTMTFGIKGQVGYEGVVEQLSAFCAARCAATPDGVLVDTARLYQVSTPDGDTETFLGKACAEHPGLGAKISFATKAINSVPPHLSLSRESVGFQCDTSLRKLQAKSVGIYYLHAPDIKTDVEETLGAIDALHEQGKFKEFGLSNFAAWQVADIYHRCQRRGMVLPTVYQGPYSVLTRDVERELVPTVRQFGMRLYVFNPLAGGMLSGRYRSRADMEAATEGRFSPQFKSAFGEEWSAHTLYQARFGQDAIFAGLSVLSDACGAAGVSLPDAALRWLVHHSLLRAGDGVIFGVSKIAHLHANLRAFEAGPLPEAVVRACDAAWGLARPACSSYFYGYGADPTGINPRGNEEWELFLAQASKRARL